MKKALIIRTLSLISLVLIIQGCAQNKSLYYWGQYEPMIYDIYLNPGEADTQTQILKLSELIEQAQSNGKKVPPGVYAHLGMAHAQNGNIDAALDAFNTEKSLYPESSVFIDGIIERSQLNKTTLSANDHRQNETGK